MIPPALLSYSLSTSVRQGTSISSSSLRRFPSSSPFLRRFLATSAAALPHTTSDPKKYSSTLLLPKTSLPQRAPLVKLQELYGEKTMGGLYAWQREHNKGEDFVFLDGPPYANGNLHMGHALNKVLKDITNRYQVLQGSRVQYIPGWDCHGLPIENKALKELKADFHDLSPAEIRSAAKEVAETAIVVQRQEFEMLGVMADWSKEGTYRTLDTEYEIRQLETFQKMVEKGLIYRRHRPTYYSPSSRTALAEAELVYKDDHVSESVYVRLEVDALSEGLKAALGKKKGTKVGLAIWTTTPWSLGSNMAVMVNNDVEYSVVEVTRDGSILVISTDCLAALEEILGGSQVLATLLGSSLTSTTYHSLFPTPTSSSLTVIPSSHVTATSGTGLVHCAPSHGLDDYLSHRLLFPDLPLLCPVDDDGRFTGELGERFAGKEVLGEGAKEVVKWLREGEKNLLGVKEIKHKYPYDWKTKEPVITRATSQWFANLDGVKESALEALRDVTFVPPNSRARLESFVLSRSEWCISRQRTWGVPIPSLHFHPSSSSSSSSSNAQDTVVLTSESLAHILPILSKKGTSYWWTAPVEEFLLPSLLNSTTEKGEWRKGTDTMDVWFDSGSAWTMLPERTESGGESKPRADVVLEGSDQHRGWFQSLLLTCVATGEGEGDGVGKKGRAKAPYGTVVTHGFALDEKNDKMSKSEGNVISPVDIIRGKEGEKTSKPQGPDVLRVWAASTDYTSDISVGPTSIEQASIRLQRYRVLLKFIVGNLKPGLKEIGSFAREDLSLADRWVLDKLHRYEESARKFYETFSYAAIVNSTTELLADLSSVYFEMIRDTIYSEAEEEKSRLIILAVLQSTLDTVSQSLAPIAPYLAEEVYSHRSDIEKSSPSAFGRAWQSPHPSWNDPEARMEMDQLLSIKSSVQSLLSKGRTEKKVSVPQMAHLEICIDDSPLGEILTKHKPLLATFFSVSHVTVLADPIDEPQSWEYSCTVPSSASADAGVISLRIFPSSMHKCPRCWVFSAARADTLCVRCEGVVREVESVVVV